MSTSPEELAELRTALRRALGPAAADATPTVDRQWRASWAALSSIGILSFVLPVEFGGFGFEVEAALTAGSELGAALHAGPYPAALAATFALGAATAGAGGEDRAVLADIASGRHVPAVASLDPGATFERDGGATRVTGRARLVLGAQDADSYVVLGDGDRAAFVPRSEACAIEADHTFDVSRSCVPVRFQAAPAAPLDLSPTACAKADMLFGLLLIGDTLGGVQRSLDRTVAYARERIAFGRPIGGFQAVQHRLVDHAVRVRGWALLATEAGAALQAGEPGAPARVALAEAAVTGGAIGVLHDLVQLSGAIGFTWDYGLHFFERRTHLNAQLRANPRTAQRRVAESAGWRT